MPKHIGQRPPQGSKLLEDNLYRAPGYTRVRWNQLTCCLAAGVLPTEVAVSLDTTDRGGLHSYAKRWWRWFISDEALARVALDLPEGSRIAAAAETAAVAALWSAEKQRRGLGTQ